MRIGLVVPGGVDRGSRERVVPMFLWLIERLARRHELHVFVLDYYPAACTYTLLGATVHDLGRPRSIPGSRRWLGRRRLARALAAQSRFDVLHAYWGMPAAVATTRIMGAIHTPVVVTLDSGELVRDDDIGYGLQRRWIDRRAIGAVMRAASALTVSTNYMARLAADHDAHPVVIPIGVDVSQFPLAHRVDGPPWRLIRVATINRVKDSPTLLQAFSRVAGQIPAVHLDVVGEDTLGGEMHSMADRLGLHDRVTFHGAQPTDRLSALYARAHLNVVSSRHESANITVLEAACTGLPSVGTRVGYIADWADRRPELAVGVPVRDPGALADAIAGLLRDPQRRERMAAGARAWAIAHDADWTAARLEQVYADLAPVEVTTPSRRPP